MHSHDDDSLCRAWAAWADASVDHAVGVGVRRRGAGGAALSSYQVSGFAALRPFVPQPHSPQGSDGGRPHSPETARPEAAAAAAAAAAAVQPAVQGTQSVAPMSPRSGSGVGAAGGATTMLRIVPIFDPIDQPRLAPIVNLSWPRRSLRAVHVWSGRAMCLPAGLPACRQLSSCCVRAMLPVGA
jgi:hypothetical protein